MSSSSPNRVETATAALEQRGVPYAVVGGNAVAAWVASVDPAISFSRAFIGSANFFTSALHPQDQRKDTLAADINVTDRQRLQFRRNNYAFNEYQPLDGTPTGQTR